jgi:hypothetical protein
MRALIIGSLLCGYCSLLAQPLTPKEVLRDTSKAYLFVTQQSDSLICKAIDLSTSELAVRLSSGDTIYFDESLITGIYELPAPVFRMDKSDDQRLNAIYQELFSSSTAFSVAAGGKQLRNTQLRLNQATFGASDNYNVSIGYVLPFYLLLKTKLATNNTDGNSNAALGLNFFYGIPKADKYPRALQVYTAWSIGKPDKFVNFNVSYSFDLKNNRNVFMIDTGGVFPIMPGWNIFMDHILIIKSGERRIVPGIGASYVFKKNRIDFGLFYNTNFVDSINQAPGIGYSRNF